MKVTLGVSRRHVHLTQEVWTTLFGEEPMVKRNDLGQPGQFATTSKVDVSVGDKKIEGLRVIGPVRKYNQIELAQSDADILGINPPRRQSGDLEGSLPITVSVGFFSSSNSCLVLSIASSNFFISACNKPLHVLSPP